MRTDLSAPVIQQAGDVAVNAARFRRHLRASGLSPKTESTYLEGVANLTTFLAARGMSLATEGITREHLEEWLIDMRQRGRKPTTVAARYRSVQQFFKWAADEGLISRSPMATMRPPKIPETPPPVVRDDALAAGSLLRPPRRRARSRSARRRRSSASSTRPRRAAALRR
jgi:site-specific recombinase XerD